MLVLSRKENETIVFPDLGISLSVVQVRGATVRLGIEAPSNVRVLRQELIEAADAKALAKSEPVAAELATSEPVVEAAPVKPEAVICDSTTAAELLSMLSVSIDRGGVGQWYSAPVETASDASDPGRIPTTRRRVTRLDAAQGSRRRRTLGDR